MNCKECPWSNPETCRKCRAETTEERLNRELVGRLGDAEALKAAMANDHLFQCFLVLYGEKDHHYIMGQVDEVEWTRPSYGHQN